MPLLSLEVVRENPISPDQKKPKMHGVRMADEARIFITAVVHTKSLVEETAGHITVVCSPTPVAVTIVFM